MNINSIISGASNIKGGANPPFTIEDFKSIYPQFFDITGDNYQLKIPNEVFEQYLELANETVKYTRFQTSWKYMMCLFLAHFITLYLSTINAPISTKTKGIISNKAVDGVSVGYDNNTVLNDFEGWGTFKETEYGKQYITQAKMFGKGGMYIH